MPSNPDIGVVEVAWFLSAVSAFVAIVASRLVRNVLIRAVLGVIVGIGLCFQLLLIAWILGGAF